MIMNTVLVRTTVPLPNNNNKEATEGATVEGNKFLITIGAEGR